MDQSIGAQDMTWQVITRWEECIQYIDNVSEGKFERSEKEEKLKNLMDTDSKLDEELSKVKEKGKDR